MSPGVFAMSDVNLGSTEAEAPVNPYSLLEAVNTSSDRTHTSWLIFIGLMIYILIAVAGVSHQDLLLNSKISLPMVQVQVELKQFFLFAPMVLVVVHLGAIMQLVMLARKTIEFDKAMRLLEVSDRRGHPLRLELHNFFFVQAIAGPARSRVLSLSLHLMTWLTLVILPVLLLLFIQTSFIPYHDTIVTWVHRIMLQIDIGLLILIGVFLVRSETSFFRAFMHSALQNPLSFMFSTIVFAYVTFFSFFVATIPDQPLAKFADKLGLVVYDKEDEQKQDPWLGFSISPFGGKGIGGLFWRFDRNLVVTGADLVKEKDVAAGDRTIDLRGRDLRYAVLNRTDLRQADLTRARLIGAKLQGTDLRGADLREADLTGASLVRAEMQGVKMACRRASAVNSADLATNEAKRAELRREAGCALASSADFSFANLQGANLFGLDLNYAKFRNSNLTDANLQSARMQGVDFFSAQLRRVDMANEVSLQGAIFRQAKLQGANLESAHLAGADFSNAFMQGAVLHWAFLDGAKFNSAELQGADLSGTSLYAADFGNAKLQGADLKGAALWGTKGPKATDVYLAKMKDIAIAPPDRASLQTIKDQLKVIKDDQLRALISRSLQPVLVSEQRSQWADSPAKRSWDGMLGPSIADPADAVTNYKGQVTSYLTELMCTGLRSQRGRAAGVVRQAIRVWDFRGDAAMIHQRLHTGNCDNAKAVPSKLVDDLKASLDAARQ